MNYINLVPGEDATVDSVNLVLASLDENFIMANLIADHQAGNEIELLGTITAMLVIFLRSLDPDMLDHILSHYRQNAEAVASERRQDLGLDPSPYL